MARQRNGKIARLPHSLRKAVNQRLLDGETSGTILEWLNAQPEAIKVWEAHFEGMPANAENLSQWRIGGYADWLAEREKIEATKELADYSHRLAKSAGSKLSEGAQAILGGEILATMETILQSDVPAKLVGKGDDASLEPGDPLDRLAVLTSVVTKLRLADQRSEKLEIERGRNKQRERDHELLRDKMEKTTVEAFMKYAASPEARAILESGKPKSVQMASLRKLIFGDRSPSQQPALTA
jgi:hypothetical protein